MNNNERRAVLSARGVSAGQIAHELAREQRRRAYHGVYTDQPEGAEWQCYLERTMGAALRLRGGSVISHDSAAALHGIRLLLPDHRKVHVTINRSKGGGGRNRPRFVHPRPLRAADVVHVDNIPVTSRARTAVDIATRGSFAQAVTVFDAVREVKRVPESDDPPPVALDELRECLDFLGRREGVAIARRALAASATRSESVGESWSRATMIEWKLPAPALQVPFRHPDGWYYSDFRWGRLIGEFDGAGKYLLDPERREYEAERDREYESAGFLVVHWTWEELVDRAAFFRKLTDEMLGAGVIPRPIVFPG